MFSFFGKQTETKKTTQKYHKLRKNQTKKKHHSGVVMFQTTFEGPE